MTPEQEIKLLKELLYCTKRSCNNCGKVNCENFQRQRIDCCGLWVSYKDYIAELENKIADIKANCDYILEGKEIEYREERNKLCNDFENMKATLESQIATLGKRCNQLLKDKGDLTDKVSELEQVNADLRKQHLDETLASKQIVQEMYKQIQDLQKENAELKEKYDTCLRENTGLKIHSAYVEKQLEKAKEIIKEAQGYIENNDDELYDKIEQFLKEIEEND